MLILEWFFDGIGTELVSLIIGAIGGGAIGYKVGIKRTAGQKQVAGDDSEQTQEIKMGKNDVKNNPSKSKTSIKQSQKAGNNAVQTQVGSTGDERR